MKLHQGYFTKTFKYLPIAKNKNKNVTTINCQVLMWYGNCDPLVCQATILYSRNCEHKSSNCEIQ